MKNFRNKRAGNCPAFIPQRIAVCSPAAGCGVSTVCAALAYLLAMEGKSVSLTELGTPGFFCSLDFERKFLSKGFRDYFAAAAQRESLKELKGRNNLWQGINWVVNPGDDPPEQIGEIMRLIYNASEQYNIFDCSGLKGQNLENVLAEADITCIVIDPLPSKLLSGAAALQRLRILFPQAFIAVNRMNSGVHRKELETFLGLSSWLEIPFLPAEIPYKAEYSAVLPAMIPGGKVLLDAVKNLNK